MTRRSSAVAAALQTRPFVDPVRELGIEQVSAATAPSGVEAGVYFLTILVGAFLLFQVELIMGKFLLPRFGGGPSVWSTSLLVFQVLLLAGYGYAAFLCSRFRARTQATIHLALLGVSVLLMFVLPSLVHSGGHWTSGNTENPVGQITLLLVTTIGLQFVLLSATNPLLQSWFGRQHQSSPYRLYALSNFGSLMGLLAYPFLVERVLGLSAQAWVWDVGYGAFVLLAAGCAVIDMRHPSTTEPGITKKVAAIELSTESDKESAKSPPVILWLALSACACMMLLATTNLITEQVGPVPLLWVLPLCLYLLSFVICFDHPRWYRREIFCPLYVVTAFLALRALLTYTLFKLPTVVAIFCSALLAVCMVCHGELARLKPPKQRLTSFYLMVSTGGALGSAAVALLAPKIFDRLWEFQIALLGCGILLAVTVVRDRSSWFYQLRYGKAMLIGVGAVFAVSAWYFTSELTWEAPGSSVVRTRNFFGIKTVESEPGRVEMMHGPIVHGSQNTDAATKNEPTTYYTRDSGIGLLLDNFPRPSGQPAMRVGVVGMGVGTLAAYGRAGDYFRFYEIDPAVPDFSRGNDPVFTFVRSSPAHTDVVLGDARIKMQEEVARGELQDFNVLVVDAFSGDAIPVHLLTQEAMDLYLRQMHGPGSVLAFHISNTNLDLRPVVEGLAKAYHMASIQIATGKYHADWILLARDPGVLRLPALAAVATPVEVRRDVRSWTDEYSNLYELFEW